MYLNQVNPGELATARGSAYELEAAYNIQKRGDPIIKLGEKIGGRDFDITTKTKLIECKGIDWNRMSPDKVVDIKSSLGNKSRICTEVGKQFEIHSRNATPNEWKEWLTKKGINFVEG